MGSPFARAGCRRQSCSKSGQAQTSEVRTVSHRVVAQRSRRPAAPPLRETLRAQYARTVSEAAGDELLPFPTRRATGGRHRARTRTGVFFTPVRGLPPVRTRTELDQEVSADAFENRYRENEDPWNYRTSSYERAKYDTTIGALSRARYVNAF